MKKNIRILVAVAFICITITMVITAQNRPDDQNITQVQITNAINTFSKLVTADNAESFGLKSADELKTLKAGKQFTAYMIQLDDLKKYTTGADVNALIKQLPTVEIALVDANNSFITSVEFTQVKGEWKATGFGATPDVKTLYNQRSQIADTTINNGKLVRIPALRTSFVAVDNGGTLNFIATEDNESLGFKRGEVMAASDALAKLVNVAKIYNGLPD